MDFDIKDIMRSILERESKAILDIPVTDDYEKAVGLIVEHVKGRGGKLVASGGTDPRAVSADSIHRYHRQCRKPAGSPCRCHPVYRRRSGSVSARAHAHHIYHNDDCDRRHIGGVYDESDRVHPQRICKAAPRRLSRRAGPQISTQLFNNGRTARASLHSKQICHNILQKTTCLRAKACVSP